VISKILISTLIWVSIKKKEWAGLVV